MRQAFIFNLVGLNMQVLTLAASFDFMDQARFYRRWMFRGISICWWYENKDEIFLSLSLHIILRRRKVLGKDKWKLFSNFKFITPQISCLDKSEIMTTIDNEIIKN